VRIVPARTSVSIDAIRNCLEGVNPAAIATCSAGGTPNVTPLSQVHYVDTDHVALSYQFFNKTRENILANPLATVQVIDPATGAVYRLALRYLRTETNGALFERMKAKLAGIASHTGMAGIFRLRGADVYRILGIEAVPSGRLPEPMPHRSLLAATRITCEGLAGCADLSALLDRLMSDLCNLFDIAHAMVLMVDEAGQQLYTVASHGYERSGVGSEIPVGQGVIGVAARERTPIRITHMTSEYAYSRAIRSGIDQLGLAGALETEIALPGLSTPHSQLAVPIIGAKRLIGILFVESPDDLRFGYDDEDALSTVAAQLGTVIQMLQTGGQPSDQPAGGAAGRPLMQGAIVTIRHYSVDDSVFIDQDYLIKGVAGAIFWRLVRGYVQEERTEFTNRELRLDPSIRLPEVSENLEARLVLLERRLVERCSFLRIEKIARGRFRLAVKRPIKLLEMTEDRGH
jgi:adenylate cyclase